jgi:hypothetical protein
MEINSQLFLASQGPEKDGRTDRITAGMGRKSVFDRPVHALWGNWTEVLLSKRYRRAVAKARDDSTKTSKPG